MPCIFSLPVELLKSTLIDTLPLDSVRSRDRAKLALRSVCHRFRQILQDFEADTVVCDIARPDPPVSLLLAAPEVHLVGRFEKLGDKEAVENVISILQQLSTLTKLRRLFIKDCSLGYWGWEVSLKRSHDLINAVASLPILPQLTHLGLDWPSDCNETEPIRSLLERCQSLRHLVYMPKTEWSIYSDDVGPPSLQLHYVRLSEGFGLSWLMQHALLGAAVEISSSVPFENSHNIELPAEVNQFAWYRTLISNGNDFLRHAERLSTFIWSMAYYFTGMERDLMQMPMLKTLRLGRYDNDGGRYADTGRIEAFVERLSENALPALERLEIWAGDPWILERPDLVERFKQVCSTRGIELLWLTNEDDELFCNTCQNLLSLHQSRGYSDPLLEMDRHYDTKYIRDEWLALMSPKSNVAQADRG